MKKILVINGHPYNKSYNHALADSYINGAEQSNNEVVKINIGELDFNPNLQFGFSKRTELEPDLLDALEKITQADHIVWFFPIWWASTPAIMKGFIDRTFLPGITFKPIDGKPFPEKLLQGKTARLVITSDTPRWYNYLYLKNPVINQLKKGTLKYCGFKKIKITYISPIKKSKPSFRENWLNKLYLLGRSLK